MTNLTIGQVARATGLPAKTIRFYEAEGIIAPVARTENGYRSYSPEVVEELRLLGQVRDLGLPLSEVKKLLHGCDSGQCRHSGDYLQSTIDNYVGLLSEHIQQLSQLQTKLKELKASLAACQPGDKESAYCCDIFHQLLKVTKKGETYGPMLRQ